MLRLCDRGTPHVFHGGGAAAEAHRVKSCNHFKVCVVTLGSFDLQCRGTACRALVVLSLCVGTAGRAPTQTTRSSQRSRARAPRII